MISSIFSRPGNIVKIGNCVSGTLSAPRDQVKRRIALATEAAWQQLDRPEVKTALHHDLNRKVIQPNRISFWTFVRLGFLFHSFINGKKIESYGLMRSTSNEIKTFNEAYALLESVAPGPHRLGYLWLLGVKAQPEVAEMRDSLYCAMLAKMVKIDGSNYPTIISVGISSRIAEDRQTLFPSGTKEIIFSLEGLQSYQDWGIPTLPKTKRP